MTFYCRRLPHWHPEGRPLFLTWRLHGSLPQHRTFPPSSLTSGRAFAALDRLLDEAPSGPRFLAQPAIAEVVVDALRYAASVLQYYDLHAFVVMPNHVHLLITPCMRVDRIARSLKRFTGRRANQMLGLTGSAFWQDESYDRWVRGRAELEGIRRYIEQNPVRAGLAKRPEEYPWCSVAAGREAGSGSAEPPHQ